ncbi:Rieske (2Fe-2S) protein [Nostoc sp.]
MHFELKNQGWCEAQQDGISLVVCPFHALSFDTEGCTVLPGSSKKTLPQLKPLELIIQGDFIWSYGGDQPKIHIPTVLNEIANTYYFWRSHSNTLITQCSEIPC